MKSLIAASKIEIEGTSSQENDFFSPSFEWNKAGTALENEMTSRYYLRILAESSLYIKRLVDYRQEYYKRRSQGQQPFTTQNTEEDSPDKRKTVCIKLSNPRWRDILGTIAVIFKTHSMKTKRASAAELKSTVEQSKYYKAIGRTDYDMIQDIFQVEVL